MKLDSVNISPAYAPGKIDWKGEEISKSILRALLYYDIFNYPLTAKEIYRHSSEDCDSIALLSTLELLKEDGIIFHHDHLYSLQNKREIFLRRRKGNAAAREVMNKAMERSRFISKFPFVRGVCISGSLSKNYFDETTDVDFFIIAEPNRLWVCRTLLVLFKKFFLLNSKKYFCVNYFIDTENLKIPDENIFTATEITTLIPAYNYFLYEEFLSQNSWVKEFLPNSVIRPENTSIENESFGFKNFIEKILRGKAGERLDMFFLKTTLSHWRKKFGKLSVDEFDVNMRTRRSVSKHHPQGFQFQVLKKFDERIKAFEMKHEISLS